MEEPKIIVAGHVSLDMTPSFPADRGSRKSLNDWIRPGKLVNVGKAEMAPGGCVTNTGLALHKFGADVTIVAKVGNDAFGRQIMERYRELGVEPKFIVCDEPVSALDVSIQAQILNLLQDLKERLGLSYLFIAHGLNVVKHISDRVGVMYLGKLMEIAEGGELYRHPLCPYTQALLSAIPSVDPTVRRKRIILEGDVPSPIDPPPGCRFASRCYAKVGACEVVFPELRGLGGKTDHEVACHRYDGIDEPAEAYRLAEELQTDTARSPYGRGAGETNALPATGLPLMHDGAPAGDA